MNRLLALLILTFPMTLIPAAAAEAPYSSNTFKQLLAIGEAFAVVFHADWCPTCRAQAPLLKELADSPALKRLTLLIANFDTELEARKAMNVTKQSTIIVFRNGQEIARSTGDTDRLSLATLLRAAVS